MIHDQELEIEVSDIYFITRLSRRGVAPILTGTRSTMENMSMLIDRVCRGARKGSKSGKLDIQTIPNLALKVVLHTITRIAGSQAPHEAKRNTTTTCHRLYGPNSLQLGRGCNKQSEMPIDKMQE